MIGLAIGAAVLGIVLLKRRHWRRHHRHHAFACGCHGGWHGRHGHGHGHGDDDHPGWRGGPYYVMAALDTTPGQEKVIREEAARLRERAKVARDDVAAARGDLAEALRGDVFDRGKFDAALGRVDAAWGQLKSSAGDSAARIHETLDARQREKLAAFLAKDRGKGPSFGPFR